MYELIIMKSSVCIINNANKNLTAGVGNSSKALTFSWGGQSQKNLHGLNRNALFKS